MILRGLLLGLSPSEVRERVDEIAHFTELGNYLEMPVRTYSAGMMLRLAFAVCTCITPEILLLDEWIGVGDAALVEKAERRLQEFVDRTSILVLATHRVDILERCCTKGVLLGAGQLKAYGTVQDVLRTYKRAGWQHV